MKLTKGSTICAVSAGVAVGATVLLSEDTKEVNLKCAIEEILLTAISCTIAGILIG